MSARFLGARAWSGRGSRQSAGRTSAVCRAVRRTGCTRPRGDGGGGPAPKRSPRRSPPPVPQQSASVRAGPRRLRSESRRACRWDVSGRVLRAECEGRRGRERPRAESCGGVRGRLRSWRLLGSLPPSPCPRWSTADERLPVPVAAVSIGDEDASRYRPCRRRPSNLALARRRQGARNSTPLTPAARGPQQGEYRRRPGWKSRSDEPAIRVQLARRR
jgi:hypothetical protein